MPQRAGRILGFGDPWFPLAQLRAGLARGTVLGRRAPEGREGMDTGKQRMVMAADAGGRKMERKGI